MSKIPITSPFKAMEEEAYHAFREWPIFLVMRQKELETHLASVAPSNTPRDASNPADAGQRPESRAVKGKEK